MERLARIFGEHLPRQAGGRTQDFLYHSAGRNMSAADFTAAVTTQLGVEQGAALDVFMSLEGVSERRLWRSDNGVIVHWIWAWRGATFSPLALPYLKAALDAGMLFEPAQRVHTGMVRFAEEGLSPELWLASRHLKVTTTTLIEGFQRGVPLEFMAQM